MNGNKKISKVEVLRDSIFRMDPSDFVSYYIFEPIPFIFEGNLSNWVQWKNKLAPKLGVDPYEIVLTGSAATGYSLSPSKKLRQFSGDSDIDVGIVSEYHFEIAWRFLRNMRSRWNELKPTQRENIRRHRENFIFSGTIAADRVLPELPFGKAWQNALDEMGRQSPTTDREVKLRIYKDYDALRNYHIDGILKLRIALIDTKDEEIISVVED